MHIKRLCVGILLLLTVLMVVPVMAATWQQTNGPEGGDITVIAIDPANNKTLYAASSSSGVFKSINGGSSWTAADTGISTKSAVTALLIDPMNSQNIYAGTNSSGIYKTIDGGVSWTNVNNGQSFESVSCLAIDPSNSQTIYAGAIGKLFKSVNGGNTWTAVGNAFSTIAVMSLVVAPNDTDILYAGTNNGLFRSTDGGGSWSAIGTGVFTHVASLAMDPTNQQTIYVGTYGLYKSTDGGDTWTAINSGFQSIALVQSLTIDPTDNKTIYASTDSLGVYKSVNGGTTWASISNDIAMKNGRLSIDSSNAQILYVATRGGGAFKSLDGGITWQAVNSGLEKVKVYSVAIDPKNSLAITTCAYAGIFQSTDGGDTWTKTHNSGASAIIIDPSNSQIMYAGTSNGIVKTTNGGRSWNSVNNGINGFEPYSFAIDPTNTKTVYTATGGGIYKSPDGGGYWSRITTGLPTCNGWDCSIRALAIDPSHGGVIYAGTSGKGVYKSTDGGVSWMATKMATTYMLVVSLAIDPTNSEIIYAGMQDSNVGAAAGVYKSTDGGGSWTAVNTGLRGNTILSLVIDPVNPQCIYAATENGIYKSFNGGGSWVSYSDGMPVTLVSNLSLGSTPRVIYAATDTGLFKGSLDALAISGAPPTSTNTGLPYNFTPIATNADSFDIENKPTWASFYTTTGTLTGTPTVVGDYNNIIITAKNGTGSISLPPFTIKVNPEINWQRIYGVGGPVDSIAKGASNTIYAATGAVIKSGDGGNTWASMTNGLSSSITCLAVDPMNGDNMWAGTYQGVYKTTNGGGVWTPTNELSGGKVTAIAVDPTNRNKVFAGSFAGGLFRSTDGGNSWTPSNIGLWYSHIDRIVIDPNDTRIIYLGTNSGGGFVNIYKSTDGGYSWFTAPGVGPGVVVGALAIDPSNSKILFASTSHGGTSKSTDGGNSWLQVTTDTSFSIAIDPITHTIYAGVWNGIKKSIDGGNTWSAVNSGLTLAPETYITALAVDPVAPDVIYAGTSDGRIFKSTFTPLEPPVIIGNPPLSIISGSFYTFTPAATNAANFTIVNKPRWASFNTLTGSLSGMPTSSDIGTYDNIIISANNTSGSMSLPAFTITVTDSHSPVSGSCGSSNGVTFFVAPTKNLCVSGGTSSVSGNGPWSWSCVGSDGGSTASCIALKATSPTTPICRSYRPTIDFSGYKLGNEFTIYRSAGGSSAVQVANSTDTSFTDTSMLLPNTIYQYSVASDTDPSHTVLMTIRTPLYNGWNMVGIPYNTAAAVSAETFFSSPASSVYEWIPTAANMESDINQNGSYSTVATLAPMVGYFVRASNSSTLLTYAGNPVALPINVILKPGWTLIANPVTDNLTNITTNWQVDGQPLLTSIMNGTIGGSLYWWNGITYDFWSISNNPIIEPWKGYWIVNQTSSNHSLTIQ